MNGMVGMNAMKFLCWAPRPRVETLSSHLQLRAMLYQRNQSITDWALSRGYTPGTAQRVIHRWLKSQGVPRGALTRRILRDLSNDLGIQIPSMASKG